MKSLLKKQKEYKISVYRKSDNKFVDSLWLSGYSYREIWWQVVKNMISKKLYKTHFTTITAVR